MTTVRQMQHTQLENGTIYKSIYKITLLLLLPSELPAALLHLLLRHGLLGRGGAGGAGAAQHGQQRGPHDGLPPQPNGNQRHQGAEPSPAHLKTCGTIIKN